MRGKQGCQPEAPRHRPVESRGDDGQSSPALPALRQGYVPPSGSAWSPGKAPALAGSSSGSSRLLQRGGRDFELLTPDGLDFWGIVLKEEELFRAALHFEKADWLSTAIERPIIAVSELHKTIVQQYCHYVFGHAQGAALPLAVQMQHISQRPR